MYANNTIYVSSYNYSCVLMPLSTYHYTCVLILLYVSAYSVSWLIARVLTGCQHQACCQNRQVKQAVASRTHAGVRNTSRLTRELSVL